jgi:hypothetical protein
MLISYAKEKGMDACPLCDDYPGEMIQEFAKSNPPSSLMASE